MTTHFIGARGYLNSASIGLPPAAGVDALREAIDTWQQGRATAPGYDAVIGEARGLFADLVGVPDGQVAIGSQVSALVAMVAAGLETGAKVVCPTEEFTSVLFPFMARGDLDVSCVPLDELESHIQPDTDLVAFSLVQSADGRVVDGASIVSKARASGAITLVDTTQAAGWLPYCAADYDITVTGAYKWLMSPRGTAFMTLAPEAMASAVPLYAGWYAGKEVWESIYGPPLRLADDARRFDLSPAWLSWVGTAAALAFIQETGVSAIHDHNVSLANAFRARLGLEPGISAIAATALPSTTDQGRLAQLSTASRAGRLRVGFHLYNILEDVEQISEALGV